VIEITGTITYADGRSEAYTAAQRELAAWERYALRNGYPLPSPSGGGVGMASTTARYIAYAAVHAGRPRVDWPEFDGWDSGVLEVTAEAVGVESGGEVLPPILRGVSDG
jgi:hypothetical protein